ncbi:two-component system, NtrC family, response regulator GlrR [Methylomarinovum caldicuralii]|uniref:Two-component system, NtrC family, response regulator GlrR n=1 Tax=Methylomarinovum caldicuralii TaxID=438856 RepID=A0AAU9C528_9GAMM|nr:sigma 54-interacting transcriptional regulator [Methylomarinovum caldicuralii]BCX80496.1 two-component system, NtrC family, response regulator GlrR [Methylomarinovum caldicuralii]
MDQDIRKRILVVDDDESFLRLLTMRLSAAGFTVKPVGSREQALDDLLRFRPHVVVTDLMMDGMDGMALFDEIHRRCPTLPIIILTAHGTINDAVDATKKGVFGFLTKPVDNKALLHHVTQALEICQGVDAEPEEEGEDWRRRIVTQSPGIEDLLNQVAKVARGRASVYIHGESGTGKELLARAIHEASPRCEGPFIAVNCTAIPEHLFESELFGHKRGAFTGATQDHPGLFQAADGGTLFLDEVGDMPKMFQVKLLRALQEMAVRPVGSTQTVAVDVRVVSASHVDLTAAVEAGDFREDLYYRLNVVTLKVPPLRERPEDIPLLLDHFLKQVAESYGSKVKGFSPEALEYLVRYEWPGNVRQLHNLVEQCVALTNTPLIPLSLVQRAISGEAGEATLPPLKEAKRRFEREYLVRLLQITRGNVTHAAQLAKRNRTEFYRLLNRHQLDPREFKH